MSYSPGGDPEDALSALIIDECHYIEELLQKAGAEMDSIHLNEAHEAVLLSRRTYNSLLANVSASQTAQNAFLVTMMEKARQSIERTERRLAATVNRQR